MFDFMKKYLLLCSLAMMCASESVGKPSDAAKTEKVLFYDDNPVIVTAFEDLILVEPVTVASYMSRFTPDLPVFLVPVPVGIELFRRGELVPYKQKGQLKAKFHPEHLFNPVKRC
jgi:hypothetical protein